MKISNNHLMLEPSEIALVGRIGAGPTQMLALEKCPAKPVVSKLVKRPPSTAALTNGKIIHKRIEDLLMDNKVDEFEKEFKAKVNFKAYGCEPFLLGGGILGKMDFVNIDIKARTVEIIDWKTAVKTGANIVKMSGINPKNDFQISCYVYLIKSILPNFEVRGYVINPETGSRREVVEEDLFSEKLTYYRALTKLVNAQIKAGAVPTVKTKDCKWCALYGACKSNRRDEQQEVIDNIVLKEKKASYNNPDINPLEVARAIYDGNEGHFNINTEVLKELYELTLD